MKCAIYTPYLDTLGGGERYMLSICRVLLEEGHQVDIETAMPEIIAKAEKRFGFSLAGLKAVNSVHNGEKYDLCVWLSDGSIPRLHSRKNIIHFQRPFFGVDGKSLINRLKFYRIHKVIVNSAFTKEYIDKEFPVKSEVLYPPVDIGKLKSSPLKENMILYVGRFSQLEQSKRQDVILNAFIKFYPYQKDKWELVLAGSSDVGRTEEVDILKDYSKKHPVQILENPDFPDIRKLYSKAKYFWSGSGYGVNAQNEPNRVEHFGMSVVESMAAGCVPLIYNGGGHREIIEEGNNGFLWEKPSELIFKTKRLEQNRKLYEYVRIKAVETSQNYSYENFKKSFIQLI